MSIPSDPSQFPSSNFPPPASSPDSGTPTNPNPTSYVDPTGAWAAFLSTPGNPASAQEVQLFMQGMLKMFNLLIQQQNEAAQRANQQLKDSMNGGD